MGEVSLVVYAFAIAEGMRPVVGAPSYGVFARQLPRMVVSALNAQADRGIRFFPLLGPMDGSRRFFDVPELLVPEQLARLHAQGDSVRWICDGRISPSGLRIRIHELPSLRTVLDEEWDFDPLDVLPTARRMLFELSGLLRWEGPLPDLPELSMPTMSYYLVARDDLLSLEANFERAGPGHWLKAIATAVAQCPDSPYVRDLLVDISRRLVAIHEAEEEVRDLLVEACGMIDEPGFLGSAGIILRSAGYHAQAGAIFEVLGRLPPVRADIALQVAGYLFGRGELEQALTHLQQAEAAGMSNARVKCQIMVLLQRCGRFEESARLVEEIATMPELPPPVGRLVASELVDMGRHEAALTLVDGLLQEHADQPGLWLEKARALIHAGRAVEAEAALDQVLNQQPNPALHKEAERLRRFSSCPDVLPELRSLDEALSAGDLPRALDLSLGVTVDYPDLAEGWLFLGVVRQRMEEEQPAIDALEQALRVDPELGEAHNRLGILLVGRGRYQDGYAHIKQAVARMPTDSGPQLHLAQACYYLGQIEEGRKALADAERLGARAETVASVRRAFFSENG